MALWLTDLLPHPGDHRESEFDEPQNSITYSRSQIRCCRTTEIVHSSSPEQDTLLSSDFIQRYVAIRHVDRVLVWLRLAILLLACSKTARLLLRSSHHAIIYLFRKSTSMFSASVSKAQMHQLSDMMRPSERVVVSPWCQCFDFSLPSKPGNRINPSIHAHALTCFRDFVFSAWWGLQNLLTAGQMGVGFRAMSCSPAQPYAGLKHKSWNSLTWVLAWNCPQLSGPTHSLFRSACLDCFTFQELVILMPTLYFDNSKWLARVIELPKRWLS